jgi:heparan-alpha-glucosaminide N-acetyltransferase
MDAYRGFVMMALAFDGYFSGFGDIAPGNRLFAFIGQQFSHVPWEGCAFWDLIQPSFIFLVGLAIPYSLAAERQRGHSAAQIAMRVLRRSAVLVLLGLVIISNGLPRTDFTLVHDPLPLIGIVYAVAFLLATQPVRVQVAAVAVILFGHWLAFALHPVRSNDLARFGLSIADQPHQFSGFFAHWNRYTNLGEDFDRWFLNLFPRAVPVQFDKTGLSTLNIVPSIASMGIGVMAGQYLRGSSDRRRTLQGLAACGVIGIAVGVVLGHTVCPLIKAIWTPSWVVFSSGWTLLILAGFYGLVEIRGLSAPLFPLIVVGVNSLAMYAMIRLLKPWLWQTLSVHFGDISWTLQTMLVVAMLWAICLWLFRRRVIITA